MTVAAATRPLPDAPALADRHAGRELSDKVVQYQTEQLWAYLARGGSPSQWFSSKHFGPADRAAILVALSEG